MISQENSSSTVTHQLVYTARQLEPILGMSHQKIKRLANKGTIPYIMMGGTYNFILEEVMKALRSKVGENHRNATTAFEIS